MNLAFVKRILPAASALLLAACATGPVLDTTYTAKSQESRVQFLVLHYTEGDFPGSLKILTEGPVSSHYLVNDNPPTVYRLVDESRTAHHAGVSSWKGHTQLNASSIGIEIVNRAFRGTPDPDNWIEYPQAQIDVVLELVKDIVARHKIRPDRIVGHSDIAPQRKIDPGPKFPWKRLADAGLIPWPDAAKVAERRAGFEAGLPDVEWFQRQLARHGFAVPINGTLDEATVRVIMVFQMKYRPARFDGMPDAETAAILDVLVDP
jgi:N-acetylmuramoyl-L-alanine amidase